ncbi:1-acyl-sn-glycerol-3-phosphate acyltransferase [Clostridium sp. YIM B02551]|uniref:lysophospholipid acyltransferase family protein n=1 Tax=Clostridium sp. YIM B02551 TaxID=2910679 RepID=UPI001EECB0EC|nr:lysophospholipid acyltransferase family protein [Clostridium sp. YIM B02551]
MKKIKMLVSYGLYMIAFRIRGFKYKLLKSRATEEELIKYRDKVIQNWAAFTVKTLDLKIQVVGRENIPSEACVFIGNHQSLLDIPILLYGTQRSVGFIAKKELLKVPVIGYWMRLIHCVPIDRENVREAIKVINIGSDNLLNGNDMAIFPEGTRAREGVMKDFKKGSMKLATKAKAPIVPVTIDGSYKAYELNNKFQSAEVKITFGEPIYTNNLTKEEEKDLHIRVQNVVKGNLKG